MRSESDIMSISDKRERLLRKGKPILKRTRDIDGRQRIERGGSGGRMSPHTLGGRSIGRGNGTGQQQKDSQENQHIEQGHIEIDEQLTSV